MAGPGRGSAQQQQQDQETDMTVTQRRARAADPEGPEDRAITEPGIKYTCDICGIDITHTVRMKCAHSDCAEIDICPNCFREGKKVQKHEPWHDYKVIEQHSYPIFCTDWGADEEMLLISGCQAHGLGNWAEVADHVGTRTKEECELHYIEVFLGCGIGSDVKNDSEMPHETPEDEHYSRFMPPMTRTFSIDPDEFQRRKKARIEELRKPQPLAKGTAKTLTSAPTNHEVGGFMPGRLEFEYELENDAEITIKDLEFGLVLEYGGADQPMAKVTRPVEEEGGEEEGEEEEEEEEEDVKPKIEEGEGSGSSSPGKRKRSEEEEPAESALEVEDPDELEVKIALLNIYRYKLDKRVMAKDLIFDRSLTQHKKLTALERKRPKEEKELIGRYKPLAKLQTAEDFEVFVEGIMHEHQLRRRITELQEYRRVGITMGYEAESYDAAKAARAGFRPVVSREQTDPIRTGARINAGQNRYLHGTPPLSDSRGVSTPPARPRAPTKPKDLRSAEGIELLTDEEALVASHTHVEPKKFQGVVAAMIIRNEALQGKLRRREARNKHHIDVNHAARIWDYLVMVGKVKLAYDAKIKAFDLKHGEKGFPPPPTVHVPAGGPPNPLPQSTIFANGERPVMA